MERLQLRNLDNMLDEDPAKDDDTILVRWAVATRSEGEDDVVLPFKQSLI